MCVVEPDAGTNLKVGIHVLREAPEKIVVVPLHFFDSTSTNSRLGERFGDGQYSWFSFLFAVFLLTVPPCAQPFVKMGARYPRAPWSRRHCLCVLCVAYMYNVAVQGTVDRRAPNWCTTLTACRFRARTAELATRPRKRTPSVVSVRAGSPA